MMWNMSSISIFSSNAATEISLLLSRTVECKNKIKHAILLVKFGIDPSELKKQQLVVTKENQRDHPKLIDKW